MGRAASSSLPLPRRVLVTDTRATDILLTTNPLLPPAQQQQQQHPRARLLPPAGAPLVKLTDFGLARAIDPRDPWLTTRCGSESYAAPELLAAGLCGAGVSAAPGVEGGWGAGADGARGASREEPRAASAGALMVTVTPRREGTYDGRETDAWALGVELFALAARRLPFEPPVGAGAGTGGREGRAARRAWLMRIARGEYAWPEDEGGGGEPPSPTGAERGHAEAEAEAETGVEGESGDEAEEEERMRGAGLARIAGVRRLVARLLVRDPCKRARVGELWDEPWMRGAAGE